MAFPASTACKATNYGSFGNSSARTASIAASCSLANAERRYPSMAHRSLSSGLARRLASNSPSMLICSATLLAMPWQGAAWTRGRCRSSWVIAPSAIRRSTRPSQTSASATSGKPADRRVGTVVDGSRSQRHREPHHRSNSMSTPNVWQVSAAPSSTEYFDESLRQHMLRVYNYMGGGLVLTGVVAFFVASTPAIYQPIFGTPLKWVVIFAPLAFIFFLSFRIQTISAATAQALFWVFCALMGLSLAAVFLVFTGTSIARTFFITAAMFGATSLYGYTTRRDLSKFGSFLFMGLIGLVIASLVNLLIGSSALQFLVSVVGVLVFTGLTAYDTQNIKEQFAEDFGSETNSKLAVWGALSLYLNFINIFQMLLNLTGDREG